MNGSCGNQTASKPTSSASAASRTSSRAGPTRWTRRTPKRTRGPYNRAVARHTEAMERVAAAILDTPGDADLELRRAVEAFAAGRADPELPEELRPYVEKVAKNAYKVVDADIDRLRDAGWSEDAIFELTLAAALGAARARLDAGLRAME